MAVPAPIIAQAFRRGKVLLIRENTSCRSSGDSATPTYCERASSSDEWRPSLSNQRSTAGVPIG
jgi:hypothetical protein